MYPRQSTMAWASSLALHGIVFGTIVLLGFKSDDRQANLPMAKIEFGESSFDVTPSMAQLPSAPSQAAPTASISVPIEESFELATPLESADFEWERPESIDEKPARPTADADSSMQAVSHGATTSAAIDDEKIAAEEQAVVGAVATASLVTNSFDSPAMPNYPSVDDSDPIRSRSSSTSEGSSMEDAISRVLKLAREIRDTARRTKVNRKTEHLVEQQLEIAETPTAEPDEGRNATNSTPQEALAGAVQHKLGARTVARIALGTRPTYPVEAIRKGLEGRVLLEVDVDTAGRVQRVQLLRSSKHSILDEAAIAFTKTVHFEPATHDGHPIPSTVRFPITFSLVDG